MLNELINELKKIYTRKEFKNMITPFGNLLLDYDKIIGCPSYIGLGDCKTPCSKTGCVDCWLESIENIKFKDEKSQIEIEELEKETLNSILFGKEGNLNATAIRAITAFGAKKQLSQMQEESAELIQAISKYNRVECDFQYCKARQNLLEEIADNIIMLNQSIKILNISEKRVMEEIQKKLNKLNGYLERKGE